MFGPRVAAITATQISSVTAEDLYTSTPSGADGYCSGCIINQCTSDWPVKTIDVITLAYGTF